MRDRYVLQVLLATLGCGVLMALIAVGDPALDGPQPGNAAAPYAPAPGKRTIQMAPVTVAAPFEPSRINSGADPTFYITTTRTAAHARHCPRENPDNACKQADPGRPGQTKHC